MSGDTAQRGSPVEIQARGPHIRGGCWIANFAARPALALDRTHLKLLRHVLVLVLALTEAEATQSGEEACSGMLSDTSFGTFLAPSWADGCRPRVCAHARTHRKWVYADVGAVTGSVTWGAPLRSRVWRCPNPVQVDLSAKSQDRARESQSARCSSQVWLVVAGELEGYVNLHCPPRCFPHDGLTPAESPNR